jgi:hypothetical protein
MLEWKNVLKIFLINPKIYIDRNQYGLYYVIRYGGAMRPNIFKYATSELSQDAFFCWLLEWSKEEYAGEDLNTISLNFINYILENTNKAKIDAINTIEIVKQEANIDFLVKINNIVMIVFEDKIGTQHHDNQLVKYKQYIEKNYKNYQVSYVYLKSDIIWKDEKKEIVKAEYFMIDIFDLAKVLKKTSANELFNDYVQSLISRLNVYNSYSMLPFAEWKNNNDIWLGFYEYLENEIDTSGIGFWAGGLKTWFGLGHHWEENEEIDDEVEVALVLDKNKIAIDAITRERTNFTEYREYLSEIIENSSLGTINDLYFEGKSGNKKNIRIITIEDIVIIDENGIMDKEKTLNKIIDIIKKFYECFPNK